MKEILLAACGAWVLVNIIQLQMIVKWNKKPLNCHVCLAGWFCGILQITNLSFYTPFYMAAAMIVSILIHSLMVKLV